MMPIGHSTGWLSGKGASHSLLEHAETVSAAGDDAIELFWKDPGIRDAHGEEDILLRFRHRSLHLVNFELETPWTVLLPDLLAIAEFTKHLKIQTAVSHPPYLHDAIYKTLLKEGAPVTAENMDRAQSSGVTVEDLEKLHTLYQVPFCLDLQHAYEHSVDAGLAPETMALRYADMMLKGNRLAVLHVSGEVMGADGNRIENHAAVHRATNRDAIVEALREVIARVKNVPIILEGDYLPGEPVEVEIEDPSARKKLLRKAEEEMREEREWLIRCIS